MEIWSIQSIEPRQWLVHKLKYRKFYLKKRKKKVLQGFRHWNRLPSEVVECHLKSSCRWSWETYTRWSFSAQGVGLAGLRLSFPISAVMWFCYSVINLASQHQSLLELLLDSWGQRGGRNWENETGALSYRNLYGNIRFLFFCY